MRYARLVYLGVGVALLGAVLRETDLQALWIQTVQLGWLGLGCVLLLHLASFASDSASWHLTLPSLPLDLRWLRRLFLVRMVGEAFNYVTPLASMGGEPVKAVLLKRYYGFSYRESGASLLLAKTTNLLALILFLGGGAALLMGDYRVPAVHKSVAATGLLALATGVTLFYLVQRHRVSSAMTHWLSRLSARLAGRLERALHDVRDVDARLASFYTGCRRRFAGAFALGFANWFLGVLEVYVAMHFLGHPVSMSDAWIIEAAAQLVRAGTFFIPASLGAQEGAFLLIATALTGNPVLGVALALIRRIRELIWIVSGLALGWLYSFKPVYASAGETVPTRGPE